MRKSENQIVIEKLSKFEKQCDEFLETLQGIKILNLNLDTPQKEVIDVNSNVWKIFCNDLITGIGKYRDDLGKEFDCFTIVLQRVTRFPDFQNIGDLKVAIHSLKHSIEDTSNHIVENDIWAFMHPKIIEVAKQRFIDGYYADSVESAFKEINSRVKRLYQIRTGEEKDGADLMRKAFSVNKPILIFEDLSSQSGKSVQQGYMDIFAGAMMGIRNPKAHENMTITSLQAIQRLVFASLLMTKVDEAVVFTNICE